MKYKMNYKTNRGRTLLFVFLLSNFWVTVHQMLPKNLPECKHYVNTNGWRGNLWNLSIDLILSILSVKATVVWKSRAYFHHSYTHFAFAKSAKAKTFNMRVFLQKRMNTFTEFSSTFSMNDANRR